MFKALYAYKSSQQKYLSFEAGDLFTIIDTSNNDWYLAQNGFGEVGFVPVNYISKIDAAFSEVLKSIDRAIEVIHYESSNGSISPQNRQNLQKLVEHRKSVVAEYHATGKIGSIPSHQDTGVRQSSGKSSIKRKAPAPPQSSSSQPSTSTYFKHQDRETMHEETSFTSSEDQTPLPGVSGLQNMSEHNNHVQPSLNTVTSVSFSGERKLSAHSLPEVSVEDNIYFKKDSLKSQSADVISPQVIQKSFSNSPKRLSSASRNIQVSDLSVPQNLGAHLVEDVRKHTNLSHHKSCVAVEVILGHISKAVPHLSATMEKILNTIENNDPVEDESCMDATRLEQLFTALTSCKDDSQQRSWALHEDQEIIMGYLEELLSILENAKPIVCKKSIAKNNYDILHSFVQYFQMETRLPIRLLLLQVFGALCGLDSEIITHLVFSVLPLELVADIKNNPEDVKRISYVILVLTMIFCTGEQFPTSLEETVDEYFIGILFETLENPPTPEHDHALSDLLVNLLLAINIHYDQVDKNNILNVIQNHSTLPVFTEKILILFNRREDPTKMFDHQNNKVHAVVKILMDIYSRQETANLLYTNDAKVLVDILIGQLLDLQPGDEARSSTLYLTQLVLSNSEYTDHQHRIDELIHCLQNITVEEDPNSETDRDIAIEILQWWQNLN